MCICTYEHTWRRRRRQFIGRLAFYIILYVNIGLSSIYTTVYVLYVLYYNNICFARASFTQLYYISRDRPDRSPPGPEITIGLYYYYTIGTLRRYYYIIYTQSSRDNLKNLTSRVVFLFPQNLILINSSQVINIHYTYFKANFYPASTSSYCDLTACILLSITQNVKKHKASWLYNIF